jgi:DNA-binding CsgD family transcriptional regulator
MLLRDAQPKSLPLISSFFPRQQLLSALNDSKVGVVICDRRMRYKALNKSVAEIHNVPIEAHLGHYFHEILGSFAEKVVPLWENVFSTGQPLPNLEVSGHLPKRTEEGRWIENLFPLKDNRGRVVQVGCFVIEISPPVNPSAPPVGLGIDGPPSVRRAESSVDRCEPAELSAREREVLRLVAEGKTNKEISSALAISVRTVETYRARLMLKLRATCAAQLVHYAIRHRIVNV